MPVVSIVIPSRNGSGKLSYILPKYRHQTYKYFEIIVINDNDDSDEFEKTNEVCKVNGVDIVSTGGAGAGKARNIGAEMARGEFVMFVGDDCIPDRSLVYNHVIQQSDVSQGFSPFHPNVMDTYFMWFLDRSGIQANWSSLLDGNSWRQDATGFCLTTNYFIRKSLFNEVGGFPSFPGAAWEDVEFGHRLQHRGVVTKFTPSAINYHFHKYKFHQYVNRQMSEGRNRKNFALLAPEVATNLLDINGIRNAVKSKGREYEIINQCEELISSAMTLKSARQDIDSILHKSLSTFSFLGVVDSIVDTDIMVLTECRGKMSPAHVVSAMKSLKEHGSYAYAKHCVNWLRQEEGNSEASIAFDALMEHRLGSNDEAKRLMRDLTDTRWVRYVNREISGE